MHIVDGFLPHKYTVGTELRLEKKFSSETRDLFRSCSAEPRAALPLCAVGAFGVRIEL